MSSSSTDRLGIDPTLTIDALRRSVVGRGREIEVLLAALRSGRHILLEGPPGTGKSTLLRTLAEGTGADFEFVEGTAELTPARLVGHFDPATVLTEGYSPQVFVDGPLLRAMRSGALLYVEEINRVPEETLNALVTVMSEREIVVPRLGRVEAEDGFRLVAAMNPFDAVGTGRISGAVMDRVCRLTFGYQSAEEEVDIVARATGALGDASLVAVVEMVRATREHSDLRSGSSVRGAIDMVLVARELVSIRGGAGVPLDAALVALSGRVRVREGSARTAEEIVTELWERYLAPTDPSAHLRGGRSGKSERPDGSSGGLKRPSPGGAGGSPRVNRFELESIPLFGDLSTRGWPPRRAGLRGGARRRARPGALVARIDDERR